MQINPRLHYIYTQGLSSFPLSTFIKSIQYKRILVQKEYILHKKKLRRQKQSNLDLFCGNCSNIELLRTMNHRLPVQSLKYRWCGAPPPPLKKRKINNLRYLQQGITTVHVKLNVDCFQNFMKFHIWLPFLAAYC